MNKPGLRLSTGRGNGYDDAYSIRLWLTRVFLEKSMRDPSVHKFDYLLKGSSPSTRLLLERGIHIKYCLQRSGEIVITRPNVLHNVYNNGYGVAFARTFMTSEYLQTVEAEVLLRRAVSTSLLSFKSPMSVGEKVTLKLYINF